MELSPIEQYYEATYSPCATYCDPSSLINWFHHSLGYGTLSDPFSHTFSTDVRIIKIMMLNDAPWEDHHHRSSFSDSFEDNINEIY